jgi:hypothetical protein
VFGLVAGGAGVIAYRSATVVLNQRALVALRALRSSSQARLF